jgi:hypothetical protein
MEEFSRDCGPGKKCPAYRAGKFPEMCVCLQERDGEVRLAVWIVSAVATLIIAIALAISFGSHSWLSSAAQNQVLPLCGTGQWPISMAGSKGNDLPPAGRANTDNWRILTRSLSTSAVTLAMMGDRAVEIMTYTLGAICIALALGTCAFLLF